MSFVCIDTYLLWLEFPGNELPRAFDQIKCVLFTIRMYTHTSLHKNSLMLERNTLRPSAWREYGV